MASGLLKVHMAKWEWPPTPAQVCSLCSSAQWRALPFPFAHRHFYQCSMIRVSHRLNQHALSFHSPGIKNRLIFIIDWVFCEFTTNWYFLPPGSGSSILVCCLGLGESSPHFFHQFFCFSLLPHYQGGAISNRILRNSTQNVKNVQGYMMKDLYSHLSFIVGLVFI